MLISLHILMYNQINIYDNHEHKLIKIKDLFLKQLNLIH